MAIEHFLSGVLAEYQVLRAEILNLTSLQHSFLSWSIVVIGGMFGLLNYMNNSNLYWVLLIFALPVWVMVVVAVLLMNTAHIDKIGVYISWIERKYEIVTRSCFSQQGYDDLILSLEKDAKRFSYLHKAPFHNCQGLLYPIGWENWLRKKSQWTHYIGIYIVVNKISYFIPAICFLPAGVIYFSENYSTISEGSVLQVFVSALIILASLSLVGILYNQILRWLLRQTFKRRSGDNAAKINWD